MDAVFLAGRILFVLVFVFSGLMGHLGQARQLTEYARSQHAPAPGLMVPLSGVAIIVGGLMVALGVWADLGALILAAFAFSVAFFMHAFWREPEEQRENQMAHFMKNMAMVGGALAIFFAYNQLQSSAPLSLTDPLFGRG